MTCIASRESLVDAARDDVAIRMTYIDGSGDKPVRMIKPMQMYCGMIGHTYVVAYCYLRNEQRTFRFDRVSTWDKAGSVCARRSGNLWPGIATSYGSSSRHTTSWRNTVDQRNTANSRAPESSPAPAQTHERSGPFKCAANEVALRPDEFMEQGEGTVRTGRWSPAACLRPFRKAGLATGSTIPRASTA